MKKIGLFVLVLSFVAMLTACGSGDAPAPPPTDAPAPPPTDTPAPPPTDTPAPANESEEAAASEPEEAVASEPEEAAASESESEEATASESEEAAASESEEVQVIEVEMNSTGYDPEEVTVKAGSQVRFNFKNVGDEEHNLFNRQINIKTGELSSGSTLAYDWTAPETPGTYEAECTIHEGLKLIVVVE